MVRCPNPHCQTDYPPGTRQCTQPFCRCLLPEAVIAGRYRIETLIGMGSMGAVYRVSDTFETQQVALKTLSMSLHNMDEATAVERFRREARYAHQLHHPNIVSVLNFGQDGDLLYITMQLITGGTLKSRMKPDQPMATSEAQRFLSDLAAAIDAIHAHPQQIVHRDIKPSNLLINQSDDRLMIVDFGIARAMQQEKPLTQRGWALGTENYMAPEQEHGNPEPASDIYSMGVIAYQLFTGMLPYQAVVRNRASGLPAPSSLNPALPPSVDPVVLRTLETEPGQRFQSGADFIKALNDALTIENIWSEPTISEEITSAGNTNVIVRTIIPENPCPQCGRENRSNSRFCRYCGHELNETSPMVNNTYQVGYRSDLGHKATENNDTLLIVQGLALRLPPPLQPFGLFAVADGQQQPPERTTNGHEASRLAVETITDVLFPLISSTQSATQSGQATPAPRSQNTQSKIRYPQNVPEALKQWLRDAVRQANQVIYHCNADYETQMGSALAAVLLYQKQAFITNVGNSHIYLYHPQQGLRSLTENATATRLVNAGSPQPGGKTQAQPYRQLGQNYTLPIDIYQYNLQAGDRLLLCSVGLWSALPATRIEEILTGGEDPQRLAENLLDAVNGDDNASAIVIKQ